MGRQILHVDMDEFFAAVEKIDDPSLCGKPLLIGGSALGRGVVSTASYEARKFGCHSAMPMATAVARCPQAIVLPVRPRRYAAASEQVFEIFHRFTPLVEPLSIDEAFLDVSGTERLFGPPESIARQIRAAVRDEIGLTASVGVAFNKFLAKLASDMDKPDGLTVITRSNARTVLDPLPISRMWGVGPAGEKQFRRLGIRTFADLSRTDVKVLTQHFGQAGEHFHRLARGIDDRPVTPDHEAKSIGQERTFPVDVGEITELRAVLLAQAEQVARRLRRSGLEGRTVTIKLRTGDFTTRTRSTTLDRATNVTAEIWRAAESLLSAWSRRPRPLRLLGMTVSQLAAKGGRQLSLFGEADHQRNQRLDEAVDGIVDRFGTRAIRRGATLDPRSDKPPESLRPR